MTILRQLHLGLLGRRLVKTLTAIETQMETQNRLLTRLADRFAPETPIADAVESHAVSFLDQVEKGKVVDYIEKTLFDTGRAPTEDEIIQYLTDDATKALHAEKGIL